MLFDNDSRLAGLVLAPLQSAPCLVMQHSCFVVLVSWHCMHRLRKIQVVTLTACFSVQSVHVLFALGRTDALNSIRCHKKEFGSGGHTKYRVANCHYAKKPLRPAPCSIRYLGAFLYRSVVTSILLTPTAWHRINRTWCEFYRHFTPALREFPGIV